MSDKIMMRKCRFWSILAAVPLPVCRCLHHSLSLASLFACLLTPPFTAALNAEILLALDLVSFRTFSS